MALKEFIERCLDQQHAALLQAVEGLDAQELSWRPDPRCMSIGFVVWHVAPHGHGHRVEGCQLGGLEARTLAKSSCVLQIPASFR